MRLVRFVFCLVGLIVAAGSARAAITYQYVVDSTAMTGAQTASYTVAPSGSVTVDIYLQETVTGTGGLTSSLIGSQGGLFGAGFSLKKVGGAGGTGNVTITAGQSQTGNGTNFGSGGNVSGFGGTGSNAGAGGSITPETSMLAAETLSLSAPNGPGNTFTGTGTFTILLGTVTFSAGSSTTQYTLDRENGSGGNTITYTNSYNLDADSSSPAYSGAHDLPTTITINVAAVPEPSSVILTGLVASTIVIGAWVRRRRGIVVAEGLPS